MYKLEVKKAPNSDMEIDTYKSDIQDIANTIPDILDDVSDNGVTINGNILSFKSSLNEREIKDSLEKIFSYHFDSVRFIGLLRC